MTISNQTILRNDYIANGTNTIFAFNFPIFYEPSEAIKFSIQVIITNEIGIETIKTESIDYTITYNALNIDNNVINQGNVVFTTAPANLYRVSLLRKLNLTQNTNLTNKGTDKFSGANVEASLDKLTLINLENKEIFNRCVLLPKSTNLSSIELPIKLENANKVITVNSAGDNLEVRTFLDQNLLPVSSFMETILVKETANEARQGLGVNPATATTAGIVLATIQTITKYTSGSGTYTLPTNCKYIRVKMVGGGGGGGGSGTTAANNHGSGANGGSTTFGTSLLIASGGNGGGGATINAGGIGGDATINSPAIGTSFRGGTAGGGAITAATQYAPGSSGGTNSFGGSSGRADVSGAINTGGGGAGGAGNPSSYSGSGGGAGGFIDAIISSPSSTYSYSIGAAGSGGSAGTGGNPGGAGGSGYIEITEYYY
jgi:hypothetical protein